MAALVRRCSVKPLASAARARQGYPPGPANKWTNSLQDRTTCLRKTLDACIGLILIAAAAAAAAAAVPVQQQSQQVDSTIATAQLVSTKGALAFWRTSPLQQSPPQQTNGINNSNGNNNSPAGGSPASSMIGQQPETGGTGNSNQRSRQLFYSMLSQWCSSYSSSATDQQQRQKMFMLHSSQTQQQQQQHYELIGVEGSTIKLNFVISTLLLPLLDHNNNINKTGYSNLDLDHHAVPEVIQVQSPSSLSSLPLSLPSSAHHSTTPASSNKRPIRLEWLRANGADNSNNNNNNNELQVPAAATAANQQPLLTSRFLSRQVASNVISFANAQNNSVLGSPANPISGTNSNQEQYPFTNSAYLPNRSINRDDAIADSNSKQQDDTYVLAPYINERLLQRLDSKHLSPLARLAKANALKYRQQQLIHMQQRHQAVPAQYNNPSSGPNIIVDDMLAGPYAIDWNRLQVYLLGGGVDNLSSMLSSMNESSAATCQHQHRIHYQLSVIQLEIAQLSLSDSSQYKLRLCQQQSCQIALTFTLTVAEDVPQLEAWPETQVLEPGDRLTIKCQATGFTLPQISWYLDGMQLSEPPSQSPASDHHHHQNHLNYHRLNDQQFAIGQSSSSQDTNDHSNQMLFGSGAFDRMRTISSSPQQVDDASAMMAAHGSLLRVGDYVSQDNRVHSFVNATQVRHIDGGYYKCQANNGFHLVEREARIDVRSEPNIVRHLANVSTLNGAHRFQIQCPYSGYPISSVEWYFSPTSPASSGTSSSSSAGQSAMAAAAANADQLSGGLIGGVYSDYGASSDLSAATAARNVRSKRVTGVQGAADSATGDKGSPFAGNPVASADPNREPPSEPDPDQDEWLSQASSMTQGPLDDYPEPVPDYPVLNAASELLDYTAAGASAGAGSSVGDAADAYDDELARDYADIPMDMQQQQQRRRRKRQVSVDGVHPASTNSYNNAHSHWVKLPQSRHHQVHMNGTLVLNDVSHSDQGYYKCRVHGVAPSSSSSASGPLQEAQISGLTQPSGTQPSSGPVVESNEMLLTVLVPPVISPFASADTLREGMRNFLTCSVIEGDAPIRLHWLKDGRPIEEHIEQFGHTRSHALGDVGNGNGTLQSIQRKNPISTQQQQQQQRIRVEASNEYTSTLYFSYVDYIDNGNYTCMATNKAASVNYTTKMLVNVPPKWIKNPKDIECIAGQNIVIDCQAEAHPSPRIWWEIGVHTEQQQSNLSPTAKNGLTTMSFVAVDSSSTGNINSNSNSNNIDPNSNKLQSTSGSGSSLYPPNHYRTIISNSRIHILENASLVIRDVSKLDQGYYLCQAANNFGSLSALVKLTVNIAASFSNKHYIKHVRLNEHVELDCDPTGQSPITATWYMRGHLGAALLHQQQQQKPGPNLGSSAIQMDDIQNGKPNNQFIGRPSLFHKNNQSLSIFGQQQQPIATNNNDNSLMFAPASALANTITSDGSFITAGNDAAANDNTIVGLGRRLFSGIVRTELPMIVSKTTNPQKVSTTMDMSTMQQQTVEIDSSMSFELVTTRHGKDTSTINEVLRLHIKQARRSHSVDFVCRAENQFGIDEKLIKLLVQEPPDLVLDLQAVQIDSRSVSIIWSAPYNGNSQIISYSVEWTSFLPSTDFGGSSIRYNPSNQQQQQTQRNSITGQFVTTAAAGATGSIGAVSNDLMATSSSSGSGDINNIRAAAGLDPLLVGGGQSASSKHQSAVGGASGAGTKSHAIVQQPAMTITGLEPMTSYEIQVRAHNQFGYSPYSTVPLIVTTTEEAPSAPPSDIRAHPLSSSSLQLTWLPPPSFPWAMVQSDQSNMHSNVPSNRQQRQDVLRALPSRYSIKGYYIGYKIANSSDSFVFKTVSLSSNNVEAKFIGNKTGDFKVYENQAKLPVAAMGDVEPSNRFKVVIGDLKRATKYALIVQAYNSAGSGPQSDPIEARTLLNDPPPAPMLNARMLTYTSIELQWTFESLLDSQSKRANDIDTVDEISPGSYINHLAMARFAPQQSTTTATTAASTAASTTTTTTAGPSPTITNNHPRKDGQLRLKSSKDGSSSSMDETGRLSEGGESAIDGYHVYYRPIENGNPLNSMSVEWLEKVLGAKTHAIIATNVITGHSANQMHSNEYTIVDIDNAHRVGGLDQLKQLTSNGKSPSVIGWNSNKLNELNANSTTATTLANKSFKYTLDQLNCGTSYQVYIVAYNSYGTGQPSQVVRAKTRGSSPVAPKKHDFIRLNSTYVVLNIDAWSDSGCALKNFEIRYRQLNNRAEAANTININDDLSNDHQSNNQQTTRQQPQQQQQWLLLSNNISPDQRFVELRDLQPETWYTILIKSESIAGVTEAKYVFMTLDKYGHLPVEAVEPLEFLNGTSLFRGNLSLMSLLHNFSSPSDGLSPLLISTSMCLILFAVCSIYYIRRNSSSVNKDNLSIDSRTTTGATMSTATVGGPNIARSTYHPHQHHLDISAHGDEHLDNHHHQQHHGRQLPYSHYHANGLDSEHYSMKVSPRKSTSTPNTSGVVSSSTTTTTNGSSAMLLGNAANSICLSSDKHNVSQQGQEDSNNLDQQHLRHHSTSRFMNGSCGSCQQQQQAPATGNKFSTLSRDISNEVNVFAQHQPTRFKTLPHQNLHHRPISTFLSPTANNHDQGFQNGNGTGRYAFPNQQPHHNVLEDYVGEISEETQQQQIYSKLRMLGYQLPSNYGLSATFQSPNDGGNKNPQSEFPADLYSAVNNLDQETLNLALNNQKLACNVRRQLKDLTDLAAADQYNFTSEGLMVNQPVSDSQLQVGNSSAPNDQLNSIIQSNDYRNLLDQNGHVVFEQHPPTLQRPKDVDNQSGCNGGNGSSGVTSSAYSSSVSAIGSSQQQVSPSDVSQVNLGANGNNNNTIGRGNCEQTNLNGTNMKQNQISTCSNVNHQQQAISNQQHGNNHQSDYALPFPPKWV